MKIVVLIELNVQSVWNIIRQSNITASPLFRRYAQRIFVEDLPSDRFSFIVFFGHGEPLAVDGRRHVVMMVQLRFWIHNVFLTSLTLHP